MGQQSNNIVDITTFFIKLFSARPQDSPSPIEHIHSQQFVMTSQNNNQDEPQEMGF